MTVHSFSRSCSDFGMTSPCFSLCSLYWTPLMIRTCMSRCFLVSWICCHSTSWYSGGHLQVYLLVTTVSQSQICVCFVLPKFIVSVIGWLSQQGRCYQQGCRLACWVSCFTHILKPYLLKFSLLNGTLIPKVFLFFLPHFHLLSANVHVWIVIHFFIDRYFFFILKPFSICSLLSLVYQFLSSVFCFLSWAIQL